MKKKHRTFLSLFATSFVCMSLLYAAFIYWISTTEELVWLNSVKEKKDGYARQETHKKIIFTSGSNTALGINTKTLSLQTGIPAYNLGIHAGLGIGFMVDESKNVLKSGDTVILPLEYIHYIHDEESSKLEFDYYRNYHPEELDKVPIVDRIRYVFQNNPLNALRYTISAWRIQDVSQAASYKSENLNDHGDQTGNVGSDKLKGKDFAPFELPKEWHETAGMKKLTEFNQWCAARSIDLYVTYPNMMYFDVYKNQDYQDFFAAIEGYLQDNGIKTFGRPEDGFYDRPFCYDTIYHLNEQGVALRTQYISEQVNKILKNSATPQVAAGSVVEN